MRGVDLDSFLIVDDEDVNFLWETIQDLQIVFHPYIAPDGKFDLKKFFDSKRKKPFILFIDRNILSSLLRLCRDGSLNSKGETQIVGLIMAWAEMNDIAISAGLAVRELAAQLQCQEKGLIELQSFLEAFQKYPGQIWLKVAEGIITEIPPIVYSNNPAKNVTVDYTDGGDHYDMAVVSLLHAVRLYRNREMKPTDKVRKFFEWTYDNVLVGEYLLVYVAMLFTGQENIKAPKNANSNDIDKIIAGCENQAWDISYLTNWSTLYMHTEEYNEEFLFATNDVLLKRIFINKNGPDGLYGVFRAVFSEKECNQLWDFMKHKMTNRVKPDFGEDAHSYFQKLIEEEKRQLSILLENE